VIALFREYLRPYMGRISVVLALLLVQAIGNLYLPTLQGDIINNGVAKGDTGYIGSTGLFMLGVTLVVGAASIVGVYFAAQISMGFGRDVRSAIFRKVESFSQVEVNRFGTPSLITRNTNDVQQV
jgi:ATP-binding cassette, subfamily B, multidrug efflux pump